MRPESPDFVNHWVSWGAGLRAAQYLVLGAKARALLNGRAHVTPQDIQALARPVLRHRILVNYRAEAEGRTTVGAGEVSGYVCGNAAKPQANVIALRECVA
jgi:MoxR-like ATPase